MSNFGYQSPYGFVASGGGSGGDSVTTMKLLSGQDSILEMKDVKPFVASYAQQAGKIMAVDPTEKGIELVTVLDALGSNYIDRFTSLSDCPTSYQGADKILVTNSTNNGLLFSSATIPAITLDIDNLTTRVTSTENVNTQQTTDITNLTSSIGTTNTNLTNLTTRVTSTENVNTQQTTDITNLTSSIGTTNTNLTNLATRVTSTENVNTQQTTDISGLTSTLSTTNTNLNTLSSNYTAHNHNLQSLSDVLISAPENGQSVVWDSSASKFVNKSSLVTLDMVASTIFNALFNEGTGINTTTSHPGTLIGVGGMPIWESGKIGSCLRFTKSLGVQTYIQYANTVASLDYTQPFSVSFWFKTVSGAGTQYIIDKSSTTPRIGWYIQFSNSSKFEIRIGTISTGAHVGAQFASSASDIDGTFNFCVFTYDGLNNPASSFKCYINTALRPQIQSFGSGASVSAINTSTFKIGGTDSANQAFDGSLDMVIDYNKVLASTEISGIYNNKLGTESMSITTIPQHNHAQADIVNLISDLSTITGNITGIQGINTTQNTNITNLQTLTSTHTTQISTLQTNDAAKGIAITNLQTNDSSQNTLLSNLQSTKADISFVQSQLAGLSAKQSCSVASTQNLIYDSFNTSTHTMTITINGDISACVPSTKIVFDSVDIFINDRIMLKDQTNKIYNGVYVLSSVGTSTCTLIRATDFDGTPSNEVQNGAYACILGGSSANASYIVSGCVNPLTVETDEIKIVLFNSPISSFSSLSDTPNSYATHANKYIVVNATETGIVFTNSTTGHTHTQSDITGLDARLISIENTNTSQDTSISLLATRCLNLEGVDDTQIANISNLQGRMTTVENGNIAQDGQISTMNNNLINLTNTVSAHNHTVNTLSNVVITSVADNEGLCWDSASSKWTNQPVSIPGHSHTYLDATSSIQTQLNSKSATSHTHAFLDATSSIQTQIDGKASTGHTHTFLDATSSIQTQLNSKSATSHTHTFLDATSSIQTQIDGKAPTSHTHPYLDATSSIQGQLNGKALTTHTHTKSNITDFSHAHVKADISDFTHTMVSHSDINVITPSDGQALIYNTSQSKWINSSINLTGYLPLTGGTLASGSRSIVLDPTQFIKCFKSDMVDNEVIRHVIGKTESNIQCAHIDYKNHATDPRLEFSILGGTGIKISVTKHGGLNAESLNAMTIYEGGQSLSLKYAPILHTHTQASISDFAHSHAEYLEKTGGNMTGQLTIDSRCLLNAIQFTNHTTNATNYESARSIYYKDNGMYIMNYYRPSTTWDGIVQFYLNNTARSMMVTGKGDQFVQIDRGLYISSGPENSNAGEPLKVVYGGNSFIVDRSALCTTTNKFNGVLGLQENGVDLVSKYLQLTGGSLTGGLLSTSMSVSIVGRSQYHSYNGGGGAEWSCGQESSTSHDYKIQKKIGTTYTDMLNVDYVYGQLKPASYIDISRSGSASAPTQSNVANNPGTRLILWKNTGTSYDYAQGIEAGFMWSGVPSTGGFKWYEASTNLMTLNGGGLTTGSITLNSGSTLHQNGVFVANSSEFYIGNTLRVNSYIDASRNELPSPPQGGNAPGKPGTKIVINKYDGATKDAAIGYDGYLWISNPLGIKFYSGPYEIYTTLAGGMVMPGTIECGGIANSGTKEFNIVHPDPVKASSGYRLRHCCVESPSAGDTQYRFVTSVTNGTSVITLPSYFKFLNSDVQIFVAPKNCFGAGYGIIDESLTTVTISASIDGDYNVLIIGTRKDVGVQSFGGVEYVPG